MSSISGTWYSPFSFVLSNEQTAPKAAPQSAKALRTKTLTVVGVDEKRQKTETFSDASGDYLELSLAAMEGGRFSARKEIEKPTSIENFRLVTMFVVDDAGKDLLFTTSTEFLNFMSEHGYEMVDQTKSKYRTDYTFKRK